MADPTTNTASAFSNELKYQTMPAMGNMIMKKHPVAAEEAPGFGQPHEGQRRAFHSTSLLQ